MGSPCKGDSGGPFMVENADNFKYYVFGIVSHGVKCSHDSATRDSASYSVFTYLHMNMVQWIRNVTSI